MKIALQAQIDGVQSKKDRTVKLTLGTQEMGTDAGELHNMNGSQVSVVISDEGEIREEDVPPVEEDPELGGKTISQRVRNNLYHLWEFKGRPGSFEHFYRVQGERIINHIQDLMK